MKAGSWTRRLLSERPFAVKFSVLHSGTAYTASDAVASERDDAARDNDPDISVGDGADNDTDLPGSDDEDDDNDDGTYVLIDCPSNPHFLIPCPKRFRKPKTKKDLNLVRSHATCFHPISTMPEGRMFCSCSSGILAPGR